MAQKGQGILKLYPISGALKKFLGKDEATRVEAMKRIWDYGKQNNLQNEKDRREIICDSTLKSVFPGQEKVQFLQIQKMLSPYFPPPKLVKANKAKK